MGALQANAVVFCKQQPFDRPPRPEEVRDALSSDDVRPQVPPPGGGRIEFVCTGVPRPFLLGDVRPDALPNAQAVENMRDMTRRLLLRQAP